LSYSNALQPYTKGFAIAPNDGANLAQPTRGLAVGAAGTVTVDFADGGSNVTLTLPAGVHPLRVTKVYATGTAATGLVGLL
jgi:hypothetical protein